MSEDADITVVVDGVAHVLEALGRAALAVYGFLQFVDAVRIVEGELAPFGFREIVDGSS